MNAASPRETALVVFVPEAEALVAPWRRLHDPSCAVGVPAHVTLLYPFRPPERLDAALHRELAELFGQSSAFDFRLTHLARFPGVLYLAPEPAAPLVALTRTLLAHFPDTSPYGRRLHGDRPASDRGAVGRFRHVGGGRLGIGRLRSDRGAGPRSDVACAR